jgi:hypothetical protein
MNRQTTILLIAALLGAATAADASVARVRIPGAIPVNPMIVNPGGIVPISQIPSINIPNIAPTIGELPLPVLPEPTLPIMETAAPTPVSPEAAPAVQLARTTKDGIATAHAVAIPLVSADTGRSSRRDTVENRLRTRRLVEFVRDTLELDEETTLEDLESAFDGRANEAEERGSGTVVLPERELEEELGLR